MSGSSSALMQAALGSVDLPTGVAEALSSLEMLSSIDAHPVLPNGQRYQKTSLKHPRTQQKDSMFVPGSSNTVTFGRSRTAPTTTSNIPVYSTSSMFLQTSAPLPLSAMERATGTLTTPTTTQEEDQQGQEQSKEGLQNPDDEEAEFDFSQAGNRDYLTSKRPRRELIQSGFNANSIENNNNDTILIEEEEVLFDSNQQENTRNTNLS